MARDIDALLARWGSEGRAGYEKAQQVCSFREFLRKLKDRPYGLSRNAPQYILDMMNHFGTRRVPCRGETVNRFRVFDAPFGRRLEQPLMGQEEPVRELHQALQNLVNEGRADRILHLHGPNGSAKSLIVALLMRGCEEYSRLPEGAQYSFHWVFPLEVERRLGFGGDPAGKPGEGPTDSYAHLPSESMQARLPCDFHDSPLLLVPPERRMALLEEWAARAPEEEKSRFMASEYLLEGEPCPRCREVYDALLTEAGGDDAEVLRHVQVRRVFFSRRYRKGAVVVSPQDSPDAGARQVTIDSSISMLPKSLSHLNILQLFGDLVDANNGILEFSDFLTRTPELNKYLLAATERGEVGLSSANVYLNSVLFATSNERHLDAFKETPDFASFKGRMILVAVPYLLEVSKEEALYEPILGRIGRMNHVAPHVAAMAALWAVLTRVNKPDPAEYPEAVRDLIGGLDPLDKVLLYDGRTLLPDSGRGPQSLTLLREHLASLREEYLDTPLYEGRYGASPREMREILYDAAARRPTRCLTPPLLFEELRTFIKDRSLYLFLQIQPADAYHDAEKAVEAVEGRYRMILTREVLAGMALAPEGEYEKVFERYLVHVRAHLRQEKIPISSTGRWEEPSEALMSQVEEYLGVEGDPRRHREDILARAAAHSLEHGDEPLDVPVLYAESIERLMRGFHERARDRIREVGHDLLALDEPEGKALPEERRRAAESFLSNLTEHFGYCSRCAAEAVSYYMAGGN